MKIFTFLTIFLAAIFIAGCSHYRTEDDFLNKEGKYAGQDDVKSETLYENLSEPKIEFTTERNKRIESPLDLMNVTIDEMEGITWYKDMNSPGGTIDAFYLYIGKREKGSPWLRLKIRHYGYDWLFIRSYFVVADKNRYETKYYDFNRDSGYYGGIWEWHDVTPTHQDIEMIKAIISSKKATIRLQGKYYYKDRVISSEEKVSLQNVLDAFVLLGGEI